MVLEEKLTYLRKEKGLSQLQLADKMEVSRQAVSSWESGATVPSSGNLKRLSDLYDVSLDYLFDDNVDISDAKNDSVVTSEAEHAQAQSQKKDYNKVIVGALTTLCGFSLIAIIFICTGNRNEMNRVPMNDMEKEVVEAENVSDTGFDFDW